MLQGASGNFAPITRKRDNNMTPHSIGLFGGSFDPVHNGHLALITGAISELNLDELRVIPCHIPPHKAPLQAGADDRVKMLELALAGLLRTRIELSELNKIQPSYTIETVQHLRAQLGDKARLTFIIGWDSWQSFTSWHRWCEILNYTNVAVAKRPGSHASTPKDLQRWSETRLLAPGALTEHPCGKIVMLSSEEHDISSSHVRECLRRGAPINDWVPVEAAKYIKEKHLYRS
ncbi:MAG: nicotinate-nucleotide adenylyltransferase [Lentisphaeria bacterium]